MKPSSARRFPLESIVYLKINPTAESQAIVTGIVERPGGHVVYLVSGAGDDERQRYECELTDEVTFGVPGSGDND